MLPCPIVEVLQVNRRGTMLLARNMRRDGFAELRCSAQKSFNKEAKRPK